MQVRGRVSGLDAARSAARSTGRLPRDFGVTWRRLARRAWAAELGGIGEEDCFGLIASIRCAEAHRRRA